MNNKVKLNDFTKQDLEEDRLPRILKADDLCLFVEGLGYGGGFKQLLCNNGAAVSSLLDFFDDNPGAIDAIVEFVRDNADSYDIPEGEDEDEEEYEDE